MERVPRVGPKIVMLSVDPHLVEHGGGVDVTVEYANAVLIRVRRPDGVYHDFPADPPSGTQVFHISPVYGGDISVTALNPAAATSGNPYGESAPRVVPVRTYTLPPLSDLGLPDLNLGIPAIQIEANEVHIGEPDPANRASPSCATASPACPPRSPRGSRSHRPSRFLQRSGRSRSPRCPSHRTS